MTEIYELGKIIMERGEDFVLAKVVETTGSTPRKKGATLLMTMDGKAYGTVGGGKIEALVEEICRKTLHTKVSKIYEFKLTPAEQEGIDMRCGGDAKVSIEFIHHLEPESFQELTIKPMAMIYGAGHVGKEIAKILKYVGFSTTILDDRPEFANKTRFPEADKIVVLNEFEDAFSLVTTGSDCYIVIVTRGHSADSVVLKQALFQENAYIGMIGSRKKIETVYNDLRRDGLSDADLQKVHSPIGLEIGAETPEEIAISVVAEMIKVRASKHIFY